VIATLLLLPPAALRAADPPRPPNVIVVLADDLGWTDLACYGSDLHETPHLDRLARDGVRFTQNYSACTVCSPTRAALMTGKYPARLHITDWIPGPCRTTRSCSSRTGRIPARGRDLSRQAVPGEGVRDRVDRQVAPGRRGDVPDKHGFDLNVAGTDKAQPPSYLAPWKIPTLPEGKDGDYLTDRLAEEAVRFIERAKDRPFFLYLAHFAVHTRSRAGPTWSPSTRRRSGPGGPTPTPATRRWSRASTPAWAASGTRSTG